MSLTTSTLIVGFEAAMLPTERALNRVAGETPFKCGTALSSMKCRVRNAPVDGEH